MSQQQQQSHAARKKIPRPTVLLILDGWGYSETPQHNAIAAASKPVWDKLWNEYPHTLVRTSGAAVGLPADRNTGTITLYYGDRKHAKCET